MSENLKNETPAGELTNEQIRKILLGVGYTIKPGADDLKTYVYEGARMLLAIDRMPKAFVEDVPAGNAVMPAWGKIHISATGTPWVRWVDAPIAGAELVSRRVALAALAAMIAERDAVLAARDATASRAPAALPEIEAAINASAIYSGVWDAAVWRMAEKYHGIT